MLTRDRVTVARYLTLLAQTATTVLTAQRGVRIEVLDALFHPFVSDADVFAPRFVVVRAGFSAQSPQIAVAGVGVICFFQGVFVGTRAEFVLVCGLVSLVVLVGLVVSATVVVTGGEPLPQTRHRPRSVYIT